MTRRHVRWTALLCVVVAATSACGTTSAALSEATPKSEIAPFGTDFLSGEVLGLTISQEDTTDALADARRAYVDAIGLYGFRDRDGVLQATLQVTRFNESADYESERFRHGLVAELGGSVPKQLRLGESSVYVARRTSQTRTAWFDGPYFLVLAVRKEFEAPYALVREAVGIKL